LAKETKSVKDCVGHYWATAADGATQDLNELCEGFEAAHTPAPAIAPAEALGEELKLKCSDYEPKAEPETPDPCDCISRHCGGQNYPASFHQFNGEWCFTAGDCNEAHRKSTEDCPGNYWATAGQGAQEDLDSLCADFVVMTTSTTTAPASDIVAETPTKATTAETSTKDEDSTELKAKCKEHAKALQTDPCKCMERSCNAKSYPASFDQFNGKWCFTTGNCNGHKSTADCPGHYWGKASNGAFLPQTTNPCLCIKRTCQQGTFPAHFDDHKSDGYQWCFTSGNCHGADRKSTRDCPGHYFASNDEGAVEDDEDLDKQCKVYDWFASEAGLPEDDPSKVRRLAILV
jgi:hypothetical protein